MDSILNLKEKLHNYYINLDSSNLNKCVLFMNSNQMLSIYNNYIERISDNDNFNKNEIELLEMILRLCNSIYNYSGENTGLSDSEYDTLVEFYRDKTKDDNFITEKLVKTDDTVYHKFKSLRGTLDKIYKLTDDDSIKNKSQKTIDDWVTSSERRIRDNYHVTVNLYEEDVIVMPKFDGVSAVFEVGKDGKLKRVLLRGDTSRNETTDVYHIFKDIFVPPLSNTGYEYGLKTEIMMLNSDFDSYNEKYHTNYKNTRSIVSSILNSDEADERVKYLQIIPLRISYLIDGVESDQEIAEGLFQYPWIKCKLKELDKIREFSVSHKTVSPGLRCDGSVIYLCNKTIQKYLGRENEKQKFEVAFKFTEEVGYSEVLDINFKTGLYATLNPVVKFKPIKLKGNTIENASLGSYARYKDLGLSKGDIIKISYDIIPYIHMDLDDPKCRKSGKPVIEPPLICSECGSRFVENEDRSSYVCPNKKCPSRIKGKILNYCNKLNIENISYATIEDLYEAGYLRDITDLYKLNLHKNSIAQLPGYKERKINNILKSIEGRTDVEPSELFGSIGIEGIGQKKFKSVFHYYTIDEVLDLCKDNVISAFVICDKIKDKTAAKLIEGVNENRDLLLFLRNRLHILPEPSIHTMFKIAFSNIRDKTAEQFIKNNGGEISDSVTKDTTALVVPNFSVTSTKIEKAKQFGIPIVLMDNLYSFLDTVM